MVNAGEGLNGLKRIEPHHSRELHLFPGGCAQQFYAQETRHIARQDTRKNLGLEQGLIGVGILWAGPAVLDSRNHSPSPRNRAT